jgi:aspartate carbamoyltransferase catalytic subunit
MRSFLLGLRHFDCKISYVAPDGMLIDQALVDELANEQLVLSRADDLRDVLPTADVVYMEPVVQPDYELGYQAPPKVKPSTPGSYRVDLATLERYANPDLVVLHSLPRQDELAEDLDKTPFCGYWQEVANGVSVRMALLDLMLGDRP